MTDMKNILFSSNLSSRTDHLISLTDHFVYFCRFVFYSYNTNCSCVTLVVNITMDICRQHKLVITYPGRNVCLLKLHYWSTCHMLKVSVTIK